MRVNSTVALGSDKRQDLGSQGLITQYDFGERG
jgi:hypothetical protein